MTIDTAPEPGSTLADTVAGVIDPAAPAAARRIMGQLVDAAPAAAADVDTRVSLTFDPKASPAAPGNLTEAAGEIGHAMIGLESSLAACGVAVLGRLGAAEIAGVIRTAFDPAARGGFCASPRRPAPGTTQGCSSGPTPGRSVPRNYQTTTGTTAGSR